MGAKRDEYNWLDDAFDDKKAREELERAQRGGTKAAGVGCIVVVLSLLSIVMYGGVVLVERLLRHRWSAQQS